MVVVSYSGKEINAKLVYYGPGLSGKTTNLEYIYKSVPTGNRGKMVSMKTRTERTLFFDFLPVDLGEMGGFKTRFLLYTVPGQVYYNATRKLVLRGVDALIFVADSERGKMDENLDSLQNLKDNLKEYGLKIEETPWVIQYNKRDLPDVYTVQELEEALNPLGVPHYEACATTGDGVFETFRGVSRLVLKKLSTEVKLGDSKMAKNLAKSKSIAAQGAPAPVAPLEPVAAEPVETPAVPEPPAPPTLTPMPVSPAASDLEEIVAPDAGPVNEPESTPIQATEDDQENETMNRPFGAPSNPSPSGIMSRPQVSPPVMQEDTRKSGFWGRILGRGKSEPSPIPAPAPPPAPDPRPVMQDRKPEPTAPPESKTRLGSVDLPAVGGSEAGNPVTIEKTVQVPITLGPDEIVRGARLRLTLEIQIEAQDDNSKVA